MSQDVSSTLLSIVIPAKNEAQAIGDVVATACEAFPDAEVIVVDDGSDDATADIAAEAGATVIRHPESLGNGAAVKSGVRASRGDVLALMDGDGQHDARELRHLVDKLDEGYDMAIGVAQNRECPMGPEPVNGLVGERTID